LSGFLACSYLAQSIDAANRLMLWSIVAFRGCGAIGLVGAFVIGLPICTTMRDFAGGDREEEESGKPAE
jgi:hypothetical protein